MWWNQHKRYDERLAQCLREDAMRHRPEFSESVHRRICEVIEIEQIRTTPIPAENEHLPGPRRRSAWFAVALAASLILVVLVGWQARHTAPVAHSPIDPPTQPPVEDLVAEKATPAAATDSVPPIGGRATSPATAIENVGLIVSRLDRDLASSEWAFLHHDAQVTWELFSEFLPITGVPRPVESSN